MTLIFELVDPRAELPEYGSDQASGLDLKSLDTVTLRPGMRRLFDLGFKIELHDGKEAQIRPRSGLALKKGVTVLNAPGTIDADYRGTVGVILINHGQENVLIEEGDRIAQMVIANVKRVTPVAGDVIDETDRGEGGFGSTGD